MFANLTVGLGKDPVPDPLISQPSDSTGNAEYVCNPYLVEVVDPKSESSNRLYQVISAVPFAPL